MGHMLIDMDVGVSRYEVTEYFIIEQQVVVGQGVELSVFILDSTFLMQCEFKDTIFNKRAERRGRKRTHILV